MQPNIPCESTGNIRQYIRTEGVRMFFKYLIFGQFLRKRGLITYDDIEEHLYFGKALVQPGQITETQLIENLKEFNLLKIKERQ